MPIGLAGMVSTGEDGDASPIRRRRWITRAGRLAFVALATYAAVSILVALFQRHLIYFPTRQYANVPTDVGLAFEELALTADDGVSLAAWYIPHEQAKGTILFLHGNAGNISNRLHTINQFHGLGYGVLIPDYRGYGHSKGKPSEAGLYRDSEAAWRHLVDTRAQSPDAIILFGRSLGGAVAIELAARHTPAALVVESTFTSLTAVAKQHYPLLPVGLLLRERYDSISRIGKVTCPKLFLHGRDDDLIPIAHGRSLYEAATEPKRFIETPGGHNEAGFTYSYEYVKRVGAFLEESVPAQP